MGYVDWDQLPLSRATTGRGALRRSEPDVVARVLTEPGTQVLLVHQGRLAITSEAHGYGGGTSEGQVAGQVAERRLALVDAATLDPAVVASASADAVPGAEPRSTWLFLGTDDEGAYVACLLPDSAGHDLLGLEGIAAVSPLDDLVAAHTWGSLRELGATLSTRDVGLATEAVALAAWHASHPRCPRCGEPTEPTQGGWVRRCTNDASDHFPRTDPAVIMAVVDADDRLLLGHAAQWPQNRFSTLAGYVEPGEPLEAAVRREVLEEVGVPVDRVEYRGSQPWPFPASLMLGFVAHATSTDVTVDGVEVTAARWFTRDELASAVGSGDVALPSRASIARALVEDWYGAELPGA